MANSLGIVCYDYVELYVGSAKTTAYWFVNALGMEHAGYAGPENGVKDRISYFLTQNDLKFVVTSVLTPQNHDVGLFVLNHGDGVKRWALNVESVTTAFNRAINNRAIPVALPHRLEDDHGFVEEAAIRLYDDTELVFINYDNYRGVFKPGFTAPRIGILSNAVSPNLLRVDHIVGNVRVNEMNHWAEYLNKALDFETFIDFGPGDISTHYSALLSKVVRSKDNLIKNPINEPFEGLKISQIEEYINEYHGSGIQHIALLTDNIATAIRALRKNGVRFLEIPDTYYDALAQANQSLPDQQKITEDLDEIRELGILCDMESTGYLLQLFTQPVGDRPTLFLEIIQRRKGAEGFGQGNFQALFEAIEKEQAKRGNLNR
jgi:4-hydroxyphenylpyruvate dioxygenase